MFRYTASDHRLWAMLDEQLESLHQQYACTEYLEAKVNVLPPRLLKCVPQLSDISQHLLALTRFTLQPVNEPALERNYFGALANRVFPAVTRMRPQQQSAFTHEPDWFHDAIGHAVLLGSPRLANLHQAFGVAAQRITHARAFKELRRLYWFTLEVGLVKEQRRAKVIGGAILSSKQELEQYDSANLLAFDPAMIRRTPYHSHLPQPVLFVADSLEELLVKTEQELATFPST